MMMFSNTKTYSESFCFGFQMMILKEGEKKEFSLPHSLQEVWSSIMPGDKLEQILLGTIFRALVSLRSNWWCKINLF